jgi:hypothetical protein
MWFEKRPMVEVSPDEAMDEVLDLPPEFNSLAEQLSNQAESLAQCYPARTAQGFTAMATAVAATSRDWRGMKRVAVASGLCAATVLVVFLSLRAAERFNADGGVAEGHPLSIDQSGQIAQLNDAGGFDRQSIVPSGDSDNVLKGLSGAEQEAVLDLIESHAMHKTSLSI